MTRAQDPQRPATPDAHLLQYLVRNDPNAIAVYDRELRYIAVSDRYLRDYEVDEAEILGKHHYEVFPELPQRWRDVHQRCLAGAIERCDDDCFRRPDGSLTYNRWECRPWYEPDGRIGGIVTYTEVTTERKLAEAALRESEERWRSYVENAPCGIAIIGTSARVCEVNPTLARMAGRPAEQLLGLPLADLLVCPNDRPELERLLGDSGSYGELRFRGPDEQPRTWSLAAVTLPEGQRLLSIADVTERHLAEERLHRIEWMLRPGRAAQSGRGRRGQSSYGDLVELNTSRVVLDAVGREMLEDIVRDYLDLLETSAAVYEANGDYALGIFSSGWCRFLDESSRRLCATDDNRFALASGRWHCHESCWRDASRQAMEQGQPVDVECLGGIRLYAVPIRAEDEIVGAINFGYGDPPREPEQLAVIAERYQVDRRRLAQLAEQYESRPPFIVEMAKLRLQASARLIGEIIARRRHEEERERLQEQLLQAQRLESVGRLAGGVAHDFNNMLQAILGHTELALARSAPDGDVQEDLLAIQRSARRSTELVAQLLAFARRQAVTPRVIDLDATIGSTLEMLRRLIGENIELRWRPGCDGWTVRIDPVQLEQLLTNLVVNARDAIARHGRVVIETARRPGDRQADDPGERADRVELTVADDGEGMAPELLDRIFDPFFTTKQPGRGSGLGLATVYGIVTQNGGSVRPASTPGEGTVFTIMLPRSRSDPSPAPGDPGAAPAARGRGETILVVEDEPSIVALAERALTEMGYRVLATDKPAAALELADRHAAELCLLITDAVMPQMNGRQLAERVLTRCPDLPVLYVSGYSADVLAPEGVLEPGVGFLPKPFTLQELGRKVGSMLAR